MAVQPDARQPMLEPVLNYRVELPEGATPTPPFGPARLEEEDPQLHVVWNDALGEIHVQLMGEVQLEMLQSLLQAAVRAGSRLRRGRHSIQRDHHRPSGGRGPLRAAAPLCGGSSAAGTRRAGQRPAVCRHCRADALDLNWQRLILTHLAESSHLGVLTGAPLTDVKITLTAGRAHIKHTEGGDFRQATYRAVRQGLMLAKPAVRAVVCLPAGGAGGKHWPRHERYPAHGGQL